GIDSYTGSLEVGKRADIIIVNTEQPHLAPFNILPEARLVYHAQGQDVETVIVDGQIMMENRVMLSCDEKRILDDARDAQKTLFERLGSEKLAKYTTFKGMYDLEAETIY
ncbi:MAG: amidohydrolase family protein, partial [Clostridia bacterium]|nr:amidohydrolase family protein [Clostridia bacterium]